MTLSRRLVVLAVLVLPGLATALIAQQMPDPSQMSGVPLAAPELPDATVSVRLFRERIGNNITSHPVTVRNAALERTARTDAQGRALFDGLTPGTELHAETVVDGEMLTSDAFTVPARGGVRIALVAGIAEAQAREQAAAEAAAKEPPRPGVVTFGGETRIILEFQDDELRVFYLLDIVNGARTPIDPPAPLVIDLPSEATGAASLQGSSPLASVSGDRVTITGPFPPGTTGVQIGYTLPWSGESARLEQRWPAAIEQLFVAIEKVANVGLGSPQLTAQQEASAGGQPFIMATGARLNAGDPLSLEIRGLPNRSTWMRTAGVALGCLILIAGIWAAVAIPPASARHGSRTAARREKLFRELVELERQHELGRVEAARYAARRQTLVAELERVMGEMDRPPGGEGVAA
jgi:hypothetical protein